MLLNFFFTPHDPIGCLHFLFITLCNIIHVFYNDFKLTDDKCSVYKITCLTSGTYFTDKELISPGEEQISQIQNLFHQVRNKSHKHGTYFTR